MHRSLLIPMANDQFLSFFPGYLDIYGGSKNVGQGAIYLLACELDEWVGGVSAKLKPDDHYFSERPEETL